MTADTPFPVRTVSKPRVTVVDADGGPMELRKPNETDDHVYGHGDPDRVTEGVTYDLVVDAEYMPATHVPHKTGTTHTRLKFEKQG